MRMKAYGYCIIALNTNEIKRKYHTNYQPKPGQDILILPSDANLIDVHLVFLQSTIISNNIINVGQ